MNILDGKDQVEAVSKEPSSEKENESTVSEIHHFLFRYYKLFKSI